MVNRSPVTDEAERLVKKHPDTPTRTLARMLSKSHQITIEKARNVLRYRRGNSGVKNRKQISDTSDVRPNQPAGWKPAIPPSLAEPWLPFDLGNSHKTAILSDVHLPYHSEIAVNAAVKFFKKMKPDNVLINGDLMDFYAISRYQKDPSKVDFNAEIESGTEFLAWLRHTFPNSRIIYKDGNHDERWDLWIFNNAPLLEKLPKKLKVAAKEHLSGLMDAALECKESDIERVKDGRPVMVGKLPVLHGHESGKSGLASSVNGARGLFLRTLSTMLVGHSHRTSQHAEADWKHKQTSTWATGCLCELNPAYWRIGNRWNWGAAFVEVDSSGDFNVENFRIGPGGEVWR